MAAALAPLNCTGAAPATAATVRRMVEMVPLPRSAGLIGRHLRSPGPAGLRLGEGGLRLQGRYKQDTAALPLVSIITVCFNAARTLGQAIRSVLDQDYDNIEYIVVDGGSSDASRSILERHAGAIDYYVSEPDDGLYHAMNKGLALASGSHILLLNGDDWYEPDAVSSLVRGLQASGASFSSALARRVDDAGHEIGVLPAMPFDDSIRFGMSLRHELMLVPSALYDRIGGYDVAYRIVADFDLAIRLYEAGCTVHEIQRPLLNFRVTGVSNTDWTRLVAEHRVLLGRQFPAIDGCTLDALADPRACTADLVDRILAKHRQPSGFREALLAYAWRRGLFGSRPSTVSLPAANPIVTVVVPCFNAAATLPRCLGSITGQSLTSIEVLCIDDGSSDGTRKIIEQFAKRDPRIVAILLEVNGGVARARNAGLARARGEFVGFVDADDELLPGALDSLVAAAAEQHAEIVRGAYERAEAGTGGRKMMGTPPNGVPLHGNLGNAPSLLRTTEGFWSCLYRRSFIRNARFAEHLRVGEDSLFLIQTLVRAQRVCWVPTPVLRYHIHDASAMRNFGAAKFLDAIDWRERAWQILTDHGLHAAAKWLVCAYWGGAYFAGLNQVQPAEQQERIKSRLLALLAKKPYRRSDLEPPLGPWFDAQADGPGAAPVQPEPALAAAHAVGAIGPVTQSGSGERPLRVATFCSMDTGGAATGSHRRIEALRRRGVDATLHVLQSKSGRPYVHRVTALQDGIDARDGEAVWQEVQRRAVLPARQVKGYRSREFFSLSPAVVDFRKLQSTFDRADIVHLHWVVGMFDHAHAEVLADKPVVWTLADMNAFTGGCHYSQGCDGYRRECHACPLLGGKSELAHESWKRKKAAYQSMRRLHIVCPSQWMADLVARSSLLGDKPIHVIPNAFPVDRLSPTDKVVARIRLGLPLRKKLLLFGADSLTSSRKGRMHLQKAATALADRGSKHVEIVLFGSGTLDLPLPVHCLGPIADESRLALVYSACDAFVFPSAEDNAPLTVGESLLCGTPVVAFPVGNLPELLCDRETGYLARHGDVVDLVRGIDWALDVDPLTAIRRSIRCRLSAASFHDPLVAADRHLAAYKKVMSHA